MNKNKMYDAVGEIPEVVINDSEKFRESKKKQRRGMMIKIGSLAACFCIIVAAAIGVLLHQNPGVPEDTAADSKYNIVSTEGFQGIFFGLTQTAETEGGPSGIWANPIRLGVFRTSITLGAALEAAKDSDYFAILVEYYVKIEDSKDETAALNAAYEFFKAQGFETGIIDGKLYLAATKAQIVTICGNSSLADATVGAEFKLANPTEEQKALESQIRY
jgi:hypothetical protein